MHIILFIINVLNALYCVEYNEIQRYICMQEEIYWMVTAHPLVRFPIFLMGMLAGLQVLRAHGKWEDFEDPNINKGLLYTLQPWGTAKTRFYEKEEEKKTSSTKICKEDSIKIWRKRVDFNSFTYIGFLTALIVTQVALDIKYDDPNQGKFNILSFPWPNNLI